MEGSSYANGEADGSCSAMVSGKVEDLHTELKNKESYIESLEAELGKAKELEEKLIRKEASSRKLKKDLVKLKSFEYEAIDLLSQGKKRIHELEEEIEGRKESEKKMYDSFLAQSKEYERSQISLEQQVEFLEKSEGSSPSFMGDDHLERVKSELQLTKDNLACAVEKERVSSLKAKRLTEEVEWLNSQLESTFEAEENSKKAMDDLAMALKEVKAEAEETKETLLLTILELEKKRGEVQNLKLQLRGLEEKYMEAKKETDVLRNIWERLRVEAEEAQVAWSEKEKGFVECIRRVEEESKALVDSLREAENNNIKAKGENQKLKDIMKQATDEANAAREENSQLKDTISKKDQALSILSQENENLKINKTTTLDNTKDLKLLLYDSNREAEKQKAAASGRGQGKKAKHHKCSTACLNLTFTNPKNKDADDDSKLVIRGSYGDSDLDFSDDPLKGSIFSTVSTSSSSHRRKKSSSTDDAEEFVQIDTSNFDEESDRSSTKKKALLKRFGDLVRRKRFQKKQQTLD